MFGKVPYWSTFCAVSIEFCYTELAFGLGLDGPPHSKLLPSVDRMRGFVDDWFSFEKLCCYELNLFAILTTRFRKLN